MSNAHYIPISPSSHPLNFASTNNQPQPTSAPQSHPMGMLDQRMANMQPRNMAYIQARMAAQTQQRVMACNNEQFINQQQMNRPYIQRPYMNTHPGVNAASTQQLTNNQIIYSSLNRLIDHINKLSSREESVTLEYWENFTAEFFDDNGLCRFLLIDKNSTTVETDNRKEFNLFKSVIPQYYHGLYTNGITDINYVLGTPKAFFSSNAVLLDCPKTQQIFYMGNTISIMQTHLRVTFSLNLKIIYWDTKIFRTLDFVLKNSINKYLGELKPEEKNSTFDQLIPPTLNEYDLPQAVMVQLEMIDVLSMMTCVMDLSIYNNIDPLEWINEFIIDDRNEETHGEPLKSSEDSPIEDKPLNKRKKSRGSAATSPFIKQLDSTSNPLSSGLALDEFSSGPNNDSKRSVSNTTKRLRGASNSAAARGRRKPSAHTAKSRKQSTINPTSQNDNQITNMDIQENKTNKENEGLHQSYVKKEN